LNGKEPCGFVLRRRKGIAPVHRISGCRDELLRELLSGIDIPVERLERIEVDDDDD
jgi:hypothetical protein